MKREIKFRVWNGMQMEHNIMAGFLGSFYVQGIDEKDSASMSHFNTKYPDGNPLMQFTGLKDISGIEIYEGDIIAYSHREKQGDEMVRIVKEKGHEVEYKNGCFFLNNEPLGYEWEEDKFIECDTQKWATVIGNIYNNPNLLT